MKSKSLKTISPYQLFNSTYYSQQSITQIENRIFSMIHYLQTNPVVLKYKKQIQKIFTQTFPKLYQQKKKCPRLLVLITISSILLYNQQEFLNDFNIKLYQKIFQCLSFYAKFEQSLFQKFFKLIIFSDILTKLKTKNKMRPILSCLSKCYSNIQIKSYCFEKIFSLLINELNIQQKKAMMVQVLNDLNKKQIKQQLLAKIIQKKEYIQPIINQLISSKTMFPNAEILLFNKLIILNSEQQYDNYTQKILCSLFDVSQLRYFESFKCIYDKLIDCIKDKEMIQRSIRLLKIYKKYTQKQLKQQHQEQIEKGYQNMHLIINSLEIKYIKQIKQQNCFELFKGQIQKNPWIFSLNFYKNLMLIPNSIQQAYKSFAVVIESNIKSIDFNFCFDLEYLLIQIIENAAIYPQCFKKLIKKISLPNFLKLNQFVVHNQIETIFQQKNNFKIKIINKYFKQQWSCWRPLANQIYYNKNIDLSKIFYLTLKQQISEIISFNIRNILQIFNQMVKTKNIKGLGSLFYLLSKINKDKAIDKFIVITIYQQFQQLSHIFNQKQQIIMKILIDKDVQFNQNQHDHHVNNMNKLKNMAYILNIKLIQNLSQCQQIADHLLITQNPQILAQKMINFAKNNNIQTQQIYENIIKIISNLSRVSSKNNFISDALTSINNLRNKNYYNIMKSLYFLKQIYFHQTTYPQSTQIQLPQTIIALCLETLNIVPSQTYIQKQLLKAKIVAFQILDQMILSFYSNNSKNQNLLNNYLKCILNIFCRKPEIVGKCQYTYIIQLRCKAIQSSIKIFKLIKSQSLKSEFIFCYHLLMMDQSIQIRIILFKQLLQSNKINQISSIIMLGIYDPNTIFSQLCKAYIKQYFNKYTIERICSLSLNLLFFMQNYSQYGNHEKLISFMLSFYHSQELSWLNAFLGYVQDKKIRRCEIELKNMRFYGKSKGEQDINMMPELRLKMQKKLRSLGLKGFKSKEIQFARHFLLQF